MITLQQALDQATRILGQAGQEDPRRDAQVLLGSIVKMERASLYAYPQHPLTQEQEHYFFQLIERRAHGEPVAYLTGHKEFYSLDFQVDRRVLIPRPETELLVERTLEIIRRMLREQRNPVIADIGTGSGIIPITLAVEEPRLPYLYACDISVDALEVARLNCQSHHVEQRIRLLQGDLLAPLPEPIDILTANLPYVGTDEMDILATDVKAYEPHLALFSGVHGLDLLLRLLGDIKKLSIMKEGAVILLEIGYQQREALSQSIQVLWPQASVIVVRDYAGWDRLVQITL